MAERMQSQLRITAGELAGAIESVIAAEIRIAQAHRGGSWERGRDRILRQIGLGRYVEDRGKYQDDIVTVTIEPPVCAHRWMNMDNVVVKGGYVCCAKCGKVEEARNAR